MEKHNVFVAGATGYVGRRLIPALLERGHTVRGLTRPASQEKVPRGCEKVLGDALLGESFRDRIAPCDTFVQLVGVAHPSPAKAAQFRSIDLVSARASVAGAARARVKHFVYVSVAQPAPVMKAYQRVRAEVEALIRGEDWSATVLRPWYILGPGHRWPYALVPIYWLCERCPVTRPGAKRLGLVTLDQHCRACPSQDENPPSGIRVVEVPEIRQLAQS
ncbi:MAG: NAD(P)H-binding protein [Verrucomicrobiota bacterium]